MPSADDTAAERPGARPGNAQGRELPLVGADAGDDGRLLADQARIGYIGKKLGRFLITAELGRGGMATVYRARDPRVGRDVAIKVIHGFLAGRTEIEARFRREANAVAAIKHPSILALYDFVPPAGEEPGYIVTELIDGPGLRQLLDDHSGRLLPEVAMLITMRVAEALGAAHAAGIVHRDVKPDNVLIDRGTEGARVVLTDFGVAHVSGLDTMTATGAVLGSPAYMSPEQARGDDVGPSSDVFSLGVLMYQLCTGRLPFPGKDPLTVITGILRGEYVRPGKLVAHIGPGYEELITRCLARDPAARPADGVAVALALRGLLNDGGIADEKAALHRCLTTPDVFARETSPEIARRALAAAEQARRRRQIPRALAEVGRALAYAPDDAAARELLNRLGSRRQSMWIRAAATGAAAAVAALIAMSIVHRTAKTGDAIASAGVVAVGNMGAKVVDVRPGGTAAREAIPESADPASGTKAVNGDTNRSEPAVAPVGASPTAAAEVTAAGMTPPRRGGARVAAKRTGTSDGDLRGVAAAKHAASEKHPVMQVAAIETTAPVAADPAPAVPTPVAAPQTSSVVLRASHGFCEPSLDAHPPSLRASYNNLTPGPHEIFCTLPQGGGKVHVATYDLRPGKRPNLIIVPGPDGSPTLGRPE